MILSMFPGKSDRIPKCDDFLIGVYATDKPVITLNDWHYRIKRCEDNTILNLLETEYTRISSIDNQVRKLYVLEMPIMTSMMYRMQISINTGYYNYLYGMIPVEYIKLPKKINVKLGENKILRLVKFTDWENKFDPCDNREKCTEEEYIRRDFQTQLLLTEELDETIEDLDMVDPEEIEEKNKYVYFNQDKQKWEVSESEIEETESDYDEL